MKRTILTVGPSFIYDNILKDSHKDMYIYRINGAHGTIKDIEEYINLIREQVPNADILMDLPGNKIRTANLTDPIILKKGEKFFLGYDQTNFKDYYKHLKVGDTVHANDSIFTFEVKSVKDEFIEFLSYSDGKLLNNKGMHVRGINEHLPFLFEKDKELIKLANDMNLSFVGLSFVRNAADVEIAKSLVKDSKLIVKIETKLAVENINSILDTNNYFLIDRGDLSTEVGLVNLSKYQRFIIEKTLTRNKNLFLATQFLKNMELNPIPSIAEIIDLVNTLKQGITGIQLSEETAVGKFPIKCLETLDEAYKSIEEEGV